MDEERAKLESWFDQPRLDALTAGKLGLTAACYRCISQHSQLCTEDQLRDLPPHTLDGLPTYLSGRALLNLSQLFEDQDVDTSDCWRKFIIDTSDDNRMLLRQCDRHFGSGSYGNDHLFMTSSADCRTYKQRFLSHQCVKILHVMECIYDNPNCSREDLPYFREVYMICLSCISSHDFINRHLKHINKYSFDQAKNILFKCVSNLAVTCFSPSLHLDILKMVKDLLLHNRNLKTIEITLSDCYFLTNLFNVPHACRIVENTSSETSDDCVHNNVSIFCDCELFDDAITCQSFPCSRELDIIEERIHSQMALHSEQQAEDELYAFSSGTGYGDVQATTADKEDTDCAGSRMESLILSLREDHVMDVMEKTLLPNILRSCTTLKKLKYRNGWELVDASHLREILVKIGCRQLTHLSLTELDVTDSLPLLLSVLFKFYREEDGGKPMEILELNHSNFRSTNSITSYLWMVNAVKRLKLTEMLFSDIDGQSILHFLDKNNCLTHLILDSVVFSWSTSSIEATHLDDSFTPMWSCSPYKCLRNLKCLQSLVVRHGRSFHLSDDANRRELTEVLLSLKSLKNLELEWLEIPSSFISDADFLSIVRCLDQLSLSGNSLGESGAVLLKQILCSEPTSLRSVTLSHCYIPGPALMTHMVPNLPEHRPTIKGQHGGYILTYLNIDNNRITRQQQRELVTCLRPLVKILFIDMHDFYNAEFVAQM